MKIVDLVRSSSALCLMTVPATVAIAQSASDPAPVIEAFNETCRRGFPNLETVRLRAESQGWIRRSARMIAEGTDPRLRNVAMPEIYGKGDMMLVLSTPNALSGKSSCGISASGKKTMDTATLAAAVSAALDGAQASIGKERGVEAATWHLQSGLVVRASVSKPGRIRTVNLTVLTS
ncbi:MAG TPA: hypothetical protein VGB57_10985 [Allosphingosinicella sp.]|jgi:hypothetical protein